MSKATTIEKNNRFYEQPNGEMLTENEQLKEWLIVANKEIERLNNIINKAIEYIESYINQFNGVYPTADMRYLDLHKLLHILKGSDKE